MRRFLVLTVLGACLLLPASGSAAFAAGRTVYAGTNSQGDRLRFAVDHTASGPEFDPIYLIQNIRCPVTAAQFRVANIFVGFRIPIRNGKFRIALNGLSDRLRWSGTVTSGRASGQEVMDVASFDNEGGLQDCGAGSLAWKARALAPGSAAEGAEAAYVVRITKAPDGSIHYSTTH